MSLNNSKSENTNINTNIDKKCVVFNALYDNFYLNSQIKPMPLNLPRIKMCGFTRTEDINAAVNLGVHAIGLVFYEPSPRYVNWEQAKQLVQNIPTHVQIVGLFVNESLSYIQNICKHIRIDLLQFHGDTHIETPKYCKLCSQALNKPYIKAIGISDIKDISNNAEYINSMYQNYTQYNACGILLDCKTAAYGGSGKTFNWSIIPPHLLQQRERPIIVSGGINANNITQLINLKPYAIDLSSGIEYETLDGSIIKGQKCQKKMQHIMLMLDGKQYT